MKLSYNWLQDFVSLNEMTAHEVADRLTMGAFEVEEVSKVGPDLTGPIVVGEIKEINPHPNADKIRMTKTIVEPGGPPLDIVCGANNIEVGQKIPVALPGAIVMNRKTGEELHIKASEIRGVKSNGMLCSPNELGITGGDSEGILILSEDKELDCKIGDDIICLLDLKPDWILHVEPRSNRGDALCVAGLAREVAAICDLKLNQSLEVFEDNDCSNNVKNAFSVKTQNPEDCPLFTLRPIENLKVMPSPKWMLRRLEDVGVRSVNNIVDITNYVMLETGQPLHAYDTDKLNGGIEVRRANDEEKLVLIDRKERALNPETLVIADQSKALGVAGVMGGKESEISDTTTNISLEAAAFAPRRVRRASRLLGLSSDSSQRFERGVDIENVIKASNRATALIKKYATEDGDKSLSIGALETSGKFNYEPVEIELTLAEVKRILDVDIEIALIEKYLTALGFGVKKKSSSALSVSVPSFRGQDVTREIDLVEEVARLYGYDNIPDAMPNKTVNPPRKNTFIHKIGKALQAQGLSEAWISSLRSESEAGNDSVRVLNPLSKDHQVLRQSLIPGLIQSVKFNIDHGNKNTWLFELGRGYKVCPENNGGNKFDTGANEYPLVAAVISGSQVIQTSAGYTKGDLKVNESKLTETVDFFRMKGVVENLLETVNIDIDAISFEMDPNPPAYLHPYRSCAIYLVKSAKTDKSQQKKKSKGKKQSVLIGWLGEIHPREINKLSLKQPLFTFELLTDEIEQSIKPTTFDEPPQTPCIQRDLTADLDIATKQADVISLIKSSGGKNLEKVELVSIFELSESTKSLSYRLVFQDKEETLQAHEIDKKLTKIRNTLTYQLQASFRA